MPDPTHDPLAARLSAAADDLLPAFSSDRHAAIMHGLSAERPAARRPALRWAVPLGLAATAAVVVLNLKRTPPVVPTPVVPSPPPLAFTIPLPAGPASLDALARPYARRWVSARQDDVARRAGQLARYCLDQLDVLPPIPSSTTTRPDAPARG